jgi:hypothetical protein
MNKPSNISVMKKCKYLMTCLLILCPMIPQVICGTVGSGSVEEMSKCVEKNSKAWSITGRRKLYI